MMSAVESLVGDGKLTFLSAVFCRCGRGGSSVATLTFLSTVVQYIISTWVRVWAYWSALATAYWGGHSCSGSCTPCAIACSVWGFRAAEAVVAAQMGQQQQAQQREAELSAQLVSRRFPAAALMQTPYHRMHSMGISVE